MRRERRTNLPAADMRYRRGITKYPAIIKMTTIAMPARSVPVDATAMPYSNGPTKLVALPDSISNPNMLARCSAGALRAT